MITWEEIRDIIEEEVYIGSGAVLVVSDAARAIVARIEEAAQQSVQRTAKRDEPEFPIYYDSQGREHGEF